MKTTTFEVECITEDAYGDLARTTEDGTAMYWSVYRRDASGLADWICDCADRRAADAIRRALEEGADY